MTTLGSLVTRTATALGDPLATTWSRSTLITWANEAIREFPIPRPQDQIFVYVAAQHYTTMPTGFREVVWVEYPINQDPPEYLKYKSHFDPDFWGSDEYYDVDRDYTTGTGYLLWTSKEIQAGESVIVSYLSDHDDNLGELGVLTIPDRYLNILQLYVIWRAWSERLSVQLQTPTAHTSLIQQFRQAVDEAQEAYALAVKEALAELSVSRQTHGHSVDGYDRIY